MPSSFKSVVANGASVFVSPNDNNKTCSISSPTAFFQHRATTISVAALTFSLLHAAPVAWTEPYVAAKPFAPFVVEVCGGR